MVVRNGSAMLLSGRSTKRGHRGRVQPVTPIVADRSHFQINVFLIPLLYTCLYFDGIVLPGFQTGIYNVFVITGNTISNIFLTSVLRIQCCSIGPGADQIFGSNYCRSSTAGSIAALHINSLRKRGFFERYALYLK